MLVGQTVPQMDDAATVPPTPQHGGRIDLRDHAPEPDRDGAVGRNDVTLHGLDRRGEFFSLLGPSGCGKTTTLRMIAGFEQPTGGQILLDGQDLVAVPPHRRPVNTVFQSYALFPHLSVEDNVAYGLRWRRDRKQVDKAERRRRVADVIDLVRLGGLETRLFAVEEPLAPAGRIEDLARLADLLDTPVIAPAARAISAYISCRMPSRGRAASPVSSSTGSSAPASSAAAASRMGRA